MSTLDYIEREAAKNIQFHMDCHDCLSEEANKVLSLLTWMFSASLAGAVKLGEMRLMDVGIPTGLLAFYFTGIAAYVTIKCKMARAVMPPSNQPAPLLEALDADYTFESLREAELRNLDERIERTAKDNAGTGEHLNRARLLVFATPAIYGILIALAMAF